MSINVSDWVHGRTGEGEMVYGFVEEKDVLQGLVTLYVVKSDNEDRVGRLSTVRAGSVKKVSETASNDLRHADELIDLALSTWDEEWFMELTAASESSDRTLKQPSRSVQQTAPVNRLGKFIQ